jgi:hypothetical protein
MAFPPVTPTFFKDPSATLDFGVDLSPPPTQLIKPWLEPGEQVTSVTVTADTGITASAGSINTNTSSVQAALLVTWLSGGVAGTTYGVHFLFSTNQGRTDTRSISVSVVAR